jgi:hypothetical protein
MDVHISDFPLSLGAHLLLSAWIEGEDRGDVSRESGEDFLNLGNQVIR